jgi:hypothetical protein
VRPLLPDHSGCGQSIHDRHSYVHQDEIRLQSITRLECLLAVIRLSNNFEARFATYQASQSCANIIAVIDNEKTRGVDYILSAGLPVSAATTLRHMPSIPLPGPRQSIPGQKAGVVSGNA